MTLLFPLSLFVQPIPIQGSLRILMLLPLVLSIAVVLKAIHSRDLSAGKLVLASAALWATILAGMFALGVVLYLVFTLLL